MHLSEDSETTVQDDGREKQIIRLFHPILKPRQESDRHPDAPPDATFVTNGDPVEVKCCTKKNGSISTVHGFTRRHLERFRSRHLIIAHGPNLTSGFKIDRLFYAHPPTHLRDWLADMKRLFDEHDEIVEYLMHGKDLSHFRAAKVSKLRKQLELSLNDPLIPWRTVLGCEELGANHRDELSQLIARYPLVSVPKLSLADSLVSFV